MAQNGKPQMAEDYLCVVGLTLSESHTPVVVWGRLFHLGDHDCLLGGAGLSSLRRRPAVAGVTG